MKPLRFLTLITFILVLHTAEAVIPENERNALLAIAKDAAPELQEAWSDTQQTIGLECEWQGVTCDDRQEHIIKLWLSSSGLTRLATEIGQLTSLLDLQIPMHY